MALNLPNRVVITDKYLKRILEVKGVDFNALNLEKVRNGLTKAYNEVYKAVAFDVDGTLTIGDSIDIDGEICNIIKDLLTRGSCFVDFRKGNFRNTGRSSINIGIGNRPALQILNKVAWIRTTLETWIGNQILRQRKW